MYFIGSLYVAQAGLKFLILLLQPPECWDYRCVSPWLAYIQHFNNDIPEAKFFSVHFSTWGNILVFKKFQILEYFRFLDIV
jgi:hypothetical protein